MVAGAKASKEAAKATSKAPAQRASKSRKDLSCPAGVDPAAPFGRNRAGKAYKRACGAYRLNLLKDVEGTASKSKDREASGAITELTAAIATLNEQLRMAQVELAEEKAKGNSAAQAKLEGQVAKESAYHTAYIQGLQKGIEMASGRAVSMTTPGSAGLASGSTSA